MCLRRRCTYTRLFLDKKIKGVSLWSTINDEHNVDEGRFQALFDQCTGPVQECIRANIQDVQDFSEFCPDLDFTNLEDKSQLIKSSANCKKQVLHIDEIGQNR